MSRRRRARDRRKAGRESIYPSLDLHGYTADEAERLAARWLRDRQGDGDLTVQIVTGRGLHSVGPPVLNGAIEDLLRDLADDLVEAYERDAPGGAYRVHLRRVMHRDRPAAKRPSKLDPAQAREAEEILLELGIHPTPALIEAEVRRIERERDREAG